MTPVALGVLVAFLASAIAFATGWCGQRWWSARQERAKERAFLESYAKVLGLQWRTGEDVHDFRARIRNYMRGVS